MFRGRSDDKDNSSQRRGSGQPKSAKGKDRQANARPGKRKAATDRSRNAAGDRSRDRSADPRSTQTGKKIRRIESGTARQADPTDLGGPPNRPPTRRPVADTNGIDAAVPGGLANRTPNLPPLQQPTGDIPRIPMDDIAPDDTVSIPASGDGVFGEIRSEERNAGRPLRAVTSADIPQAFGDLTDGEPLSTGDELDRAQAELRAADPRSARNGAREIPSALPDFDDVATDLPQQAMASTPQAMADQAEIMAGRADDLTGQVDDLAGQADDIDGYSATAGDYAAVGAAAMTGDVASGMAGRDPFEVPSQSPALTAAGRTRQPNPIDATRPMDQGMGGGGFGDPRAAGAAPARRSDGGRPRGGERRDRPQDTEFKLADNRPRQKPKEPNRFLLAAGLGVVLLLGAAAAWYFTRSSDGADVATADTEEVVAESTDEATTATDPATPEATVAPEPLVNEPTLFFDAATTGPLQQGETYSIDLVGEPEGSMLQVVVDDIPQGNPDLLLPDLILPAGRHTIYIQMTNGAEVSQSTPVELYVLGDPPPQGFRANLSSVDMQTEGWAEAIRQFDEYRAAGHDALQLLPISPGYWNLFIGGLGEDRAAAQTYCESFSLAVPDQCFPTYYESTAADTTATTGDETGDDAMTDEDPDAMADEDTTSTTVAGG